MSLAAVVTDLIFSTKIIAEARAQVRGVRVLRSIKAMDELFLSTPPVCLIVDLNCTGIDGIAAITRAKTHSPACQILAFLSHVQQDLAQKAKEAGAEQVVPRSTFVTLLPELITTYADSVTQS